jgi:hypothetical protein
MSPRTLLPLVAVTAAAGLAAQQTAVFPAEYTAVAEGPNNSPNLPLANGSSRVMVVYDRADMAVPDGASITQLGFRQDGTLTAMDTGRALQLEIRMGWTTASATAPSTTFDTNYDAPPVTVFGPGLFQLPNLRDASNPLPNGQLFVPLAAPFVYAPAGRNLVVEYRVSGNSGGGSSFNYRLDRADFYSPVLTGSPGCATSGNQVPVLNANPTRIGQTLTLTGTTGPANSFGVIAIDVGGRLAAPFPLDVVFGGIAPTCTGQLLPVNLATLGAATTTTGGFTASYAIPNVPALNDLWVAHQALLIDVFAPGGLVVSNGVEVQIGIRPRTSIVAAQGLPSQLTTGTLNANYAPVAFFTWQ